MVVSAVEQCYVMVLFAQGVANRFMVADEPEDVLLDLSSSNCGKKFVRVGAKTVKVYQFERRVKTWQLVASTDSTIDDIIDASKKLKEDASGGNPAVDALKSLNVRTLWKLDGKMFMVSYLWSSPHPELLKGSEIMQSEVDFYRISIDTEKILKTPDANNVATMQSGEIVYKPDWISQEVDLPPIEIPSYKVNY